MGFPSFASGDVLNASDMNAVGLWLIKSTTLSSTSVTVTDAFSTTYNSYRIIISNGTLSGTANINCKLGATTTGYYSSRIYNAPNSGTVLGNGVNNGGDWAYFGQGSTGGLNLCVDIHNPFLSRITTYSGSYIFVTGAGAELGTTQGFLDNTTSYTSFVIGSAQTFNSGTVYVYGYKK